MANGSNRAIDDPSPPATNAPELSVSELANALKRTVEDRFGHVRVRGEISQLSRPAFIRTLLFLPEGPERATRRRHMERHTIAPVALVLRKVSK